MSSQSTPNRVCGPEVTMYHSSCAPFVSYMCGNLGNNNRVNSDLTSRLYITDQTTCYSSGCCVCGGTPFSASDNYTLEITIYVRTWVESLGWSASGFASVDLAHDDGFTVGPITLH
jgi:hypothetical protein